MTCLFTRAFAGAVGGLAATVPMSVLMLVGHQWLPRGQRDSLPPQQITDELLETVGLEDALSRRDRAALAVANHFAYGTAAGSLYGGLTGLGQPLNPVSAGIAYGLGVWAGSYLGLVPALGLYRSATEEPAGRNVLMIAAHVVWGASLGVITELAAGERTEERHRSCTHAGDGSPTKENRNAYESQTVQAT